ncbi:hypothetical protein [Paenibacillus sp. HB172176]|uniref:glycosyl hydrolase family 95 catalytic domain-containing protein n=1 Tax=Paenibacillus sp. HB172176 TaxID=2493690 RepID=UPI00143BB138|nr:hypothetical protein [Paenibacillus sp. HB172176]
MKSLKQLIATADLRYEGIERIAEAGLPFGNGRMGTLVWLTPRELRMQINRVDLFASDAASTSFSDLDSDYYGGCGLIDIQFGEAVFTSQTRQHLSVYDGRIEIEAEQVHIACFALPDQDAFIVEITDRRELPKPISVHLRTMRGGSEYTVGRRPYIHPSLRKDGAYTYVRTHHHLATSILHQSNRRLSLTQIFEEGQYDSRSFLELEGFGRTAEAWNRNSAESVLTFEAGRGSLTVAIATAQSFDRQEKLCTALSAIGAESFPALSANARTWWHQFWSRAPLMRLESQDGSANAVAMHAVFFLYLMASVSRGSHMARYAGLLFKTAGDFGMWGAQYWWHNQSCYYSPLVAAGCFELADAFYEQIWNNRAAYRTAARQQWGSQGMFIPETCWFNGPDELPESLASEMEELYTNRKPWEERSAAFRLNAEGRNPFESRWNWQCVVKPEDEETVAPYSYVNHIFSTTAKIAYLFWVRYRTTGDEDWLRNRAYPMLKDAADLYLHLPFVEEGEDGYLHLRHVNNHEDMWDASDTISELAAIHGILPIAVKAAEILKLDEEHRHVWSVFERRMTPILTNVSKGTLAPRQEGEEECWSSGAGPVRRGRESYYHAMDPVILYDLITPATPDSRQRSLAESTYRKCLQLRGFGTSACSIGELDPFVIAPGRMGDKEAVEQFVPKLLLEVSPDNFCDPEGSGFTVILDNRLTLREGPQAISGQRMGQATEAMINALCRAFPPSPAEEPVLHLFSALPESWDAEIRLPAANGYQVEACKRNGTIEYVKLTASRDLPLLVCNPWGEREAVIDYGSHSERHSGKQFQVKGSCELSEGAGD